MKSATEILLGAAFVLTPRENWVGKDKVGGYFCEVCAYTAICHCAAEIAPRSKAVALRSMLLAINQPHGCDGDIWVFNDTHTHLQVLAALYKAAELSEQS